MKKKDFKYSSPQEEIKEEEIKESWIVIDKSTNNALYGLKCKTLTFNSENEADNFGKQICNSYIVISIKY